MSVARTVRLTGAAGILVLGTSGCGIAIGGDTGETPQSALDPAGPIARMQDDAWQILLPSTVAVFAVVAVAMVFMLVRYRARGDGTEVPKQTHNNTVAMSAWLIVTVLLLGAIKVSTYMVGNEAVRYEPGGSTVDVRVVAKQYWWEFEYMDREALGVTSANELHIPTDQEVFLEMEALSADLPDQGADNNDGETLNGVIHSFWVPRLSGKVDVIPGTTRELTLVAEEPGTYLGQCAEFCGLGHDDMRFRVVAHEPDDFEDWLEGQGEEAELGLDGLAGQGEELFERHACIDCHAIDGYETEDGIEADVRVAPNLTHFNSREVFAGGTLDVDDDEQLHAWIENPQSQKPGAQMPDFDVPSRDIDALIAFLRTLD